MDWQMEGPMDGLKEKQVELRSRDYKCINDPSTIKPILGELWMNLNVFLKAEIPFYGNFLFCVSQEGMSEDH